MSDEKLQKILARAGLGSRREMERWIDEGRVRIFKKVAKLGDRAKLSDKIFVDNKLLPMASYQKADTRVLMYHKPVGEVCTRHDEEDRTTVFDHLPILDRGRWICVGRLDVNTSGLLLFTNDGDFANKLMHPSSEIAREYAVRVMGKLSDQKGKLLTTGVELSDGVARFEHIVGSAEKSKGRNHWYHLVCMEGRNRIVRRMFEAVDLPVNRLMRVRFGRLLLPRELKAGDFKEVAATTII